MEGQTFSRSCSVGYGQLFSLILGISKIWKEYLRFLFTDYASARRLERPAEISVKFELCNIANALLEGWAFSLFPSALNLEYHLPNMSYVSLQQRWQYLLIEF